MTHPLVSRIPVAETKWGGGAAEEKKENRIPVNYQHSNEAKQTPKTLKCDLPCHFKLVVKEFHIDSQLS